jgi:hypothetical protein
MTTARYTSQQYRDSAALHLERAKTALYHAKRGRRAGLHGFAVLNSAAAQHYRLAYIQRMREAQEAEIMTGVEE